MEYVKLLLVTIYVFCFKISLAQVDDDNCYGATFTGGTKNCSGFENKHFLCNLNIAISNDDGERGMILTGDMEVVEDLCDDLEIVLKVWKDIGTGKQYMYNIETNFCASLKKEDSPWKPLVEALGTTDCPVPKGLYIVEDMMMSIDFAKDVLNHEFCGDYVVEISFTRNEEPISCYEIGVAVEEEPCE